MRALAKILAATALAATLVTGSPLLARQSAQEKQSESADQGWQKEFDDVCSKTQDAMSLSIADLTLLVKRCDALVPRIEKLDETRRKVFLRRLQQCRGLYAYVLESKNNDKK
jgi:hypothetical protein